QTFPALNEAALNENAGIGSDTATNAAAQHLTRWYSKPNAVDAKLQAATGGRYAKAHCDGTPLTANDIAEVRVDGAVPAPGPYSGPLDWNNDLTAGDAVTGPIDVDYNGSTSNSPFSGYNDWDNANFQQMSARASAFNFSQAGELKNGGGGLKNGGGGI